ncbi:MAG: FAD-dependent oxidoreductase [Sulfurovum sp.]|nr:FAD-dependent oxidoreductase [Sulfurovum sp.]
MHKHTKIAIIGAGAAGATAALYLGQLGLDVTLYERESSIINGPPFCHLHAGGNLYREISDQQCIDLLRQSIDFLRYYPFVVDYRPTVIAVPIGDKGTAIQLIPRLKLLKNEYQKLIDADSSNKVLGESENYYKLYSKDEILKLSKKDTVTTPKNSDEWMIAVAKNIDLNKVQFPLVLVQEYGLNLFRLGGGLTTLLEKMKNIDVKLNTTITHIKTNDRGWQIRYQNADTESTNQYDYLINAAGFRTGEIDDMLGLTCQRMVEFKAAYVTKCDTKGTLWPEIIFHGKRGTPEGMAQFTPYPDGHFQLHGMTTDITLFEGGLVSSQSNYVQPKLHSIFVAKIEKGWQPQIVKERTKAAIKHLSKFIPNFATANLASKPLYGAQQIPGFDPELRVAEVSFPIERYARCEIVKVSSIIDMMDAIVDNMKKTEYLPKETSRVRSLEHLQYISEDEINKRAVEMCKLRDYPQELAGLTVPKQLLSF